MESVLRPWFVCSSVAKLATALANDVAAVIGWLPQGEELLQGDYAHIANVKVWKSWEGSS